MASLLLDKVNDLRFALVGAGIRAYLGTTGAHLNIPLGDKWRRWYTYKDAVTQKIYFVDEEVTPATAGILSTYIKNDKLWSTMKIPATGNYPALIGNGDIRDTTSGIITYNVNFGNVPLGNTAAGNPTNCVFIVNDELFVLRK